MYAYPVLVVDDDASLRQFLASSLQDAGFMVSSATTGQQALELIRREKPLIMLLSLAMPDLSGDEVCRIVKDDPVMRDIIIFILGAKDDLETKLTCFASGANEYLVKPVEPRELVARIRRFLRMIDEFRNTPQPLMESPPLEKHDIVIEKKGLHSTTASVSFTESFSRVKPSYGVYRVESLIGSGGMGHVFKAYDEPLERYVAVKILSQKLSSSPEFVERFRREAKVLAAINHSGIAFIYSFGEEEGEHYFAMQWCDGGSLADVIRKEEHVPLLQALDVMLQTTQALMVAAKKGIVHRDIKPSNILFDENQQVKIVDFGLASAEQLSTRITHAQEFLGTPSFMAPEQAQDANVNHRADIYSLGITFYYMLYGELPFTANTAIEMVIKHATHPFPAFSDLGGTVPRDAYTIIEKMTQKDPEARYADYPSLIQDLEKLRNKILSQSMWKIPRAVLTPANASKTFSSLFELLSELHNQAASGYFTARWSALEKTFLVRNREILLFESRQQDENVFNALVQKGKLKKEEAPDSKEDLESSVNRLVLSHSLGIDDFKNTYRDLMKASVMQAFFWPVFEGAFYSSPVENDPFTSVKISDLLLEASRNMVEYQVISDHLRPEHSFSRTSNFEQVLSTLNMKPEESFIASRFEDQPLNIETLRLLTGLPEENIARFIFALERLGGLKVKAREEKRTARRPEIPQPEVIQKRQEVVERQEIIRPIPATSDPETPMRSPHAAQFSTPTPTPRDLHQTPSGSVSKMERDYLIEIQAKRMNPPAPPAVTSLDTPKPEMADAGAVRMEMQKTEKKIEVEHHIKVAEQFYSLAHQKFLELDYWKVTQLCKQAIRHNPNESKYYHLMASAYAQHPRFGKDAEQCFYKALELDPWNPDYHVDLADFYIHQGLTLRALVQCEKALKIAPHHAKAKEMHGSLKSKNR